MIYDGMTIFIGCNRAYARDTFRNIREVENLDFIEFRQFSRSDGRLGRPVPCCTFLNLLKLLAMLPGARASLLRQNMADITTRAVAGDRDLETAMPERRAAMGSKAQELAMNGIASGGDAHQKRQLDAEVASEQIQHPKYRWLE